MKLADNKIYLASKSPRRRELLHQIGIPFELMMLRDSQARPLDVDETVLPNESPHEYVRRVTNAKAQAAWNIVSFRKLPLHPVLAADTSVVLNGVIYGKPKNRDDARAMLSHLSGQTHQVLTHIVVRYHRQHKECTQTSEVTFCTLTQSQIDSYCDTSEPYGKAGSYAIQGYAAQFISHISGSYSGIMGLPLFETAKLLSELEI